MAWRRGPPGSESTACLHGDPRGTWENLSLPSQRRDGEPGDQFSRPKGVASHAPGSEEAVQGGIAEPGNGAKRDG
jgi:hypothetical protein